MRRTVVCAALSMHGCWSSKAAPVPTQPPPWQHCGSTALTVTAAVPSIPVASACGRTQARLADGRWLAVGERCAELHVDGVWRPTTPPPSAVTESPLIAMADGRVLLAGGRRDDAAVADAQLFDPRTQRWQSVAPLHTARLGHGALRLRDGRVLITGGCSEPADYCGQDGAVLSLEVYNPAKDSWEVQPLRYGEARFGNALVELVDGRVLSLGGKERDSLELPASAVWDGKRWCAAPKLLSFRHRAQAELRPDGLSVVVTGHVDDEGPAAEIYYLGKECWTSCR